MQRFGHLAVSCCLGVGLIAASAQTRATAGTAYNAVTDFSPTNNPNGVWSYLDDYRKLPVKGNACGSESFPVWWSGLPEPDSVYVSRNLSHATGGCLTIQDPVDHLWMDPEGHTVTVRWRAPASGTYRVVGNFLGIDTSEHPHPVHVTQGLHTMLFTGTIDAYGQNLAFSKTLTLDKGQYVDFDVLTGEDDFTNLSTGLAATITLKTDAF